MKKNYEISEIGTPSINDCYIKHIVINKEYPYSNCSHKSTIRFKCLNDCIVNTKNRKLSKYYYEPYTEIGLIYLEYQENEMTKITKKNAICKISGNICKQVYFRQIPIEDTKDKNGIEIKQL